MLCNRCLIMMKPGTSYQHKNGKVISKKYDECPKCHDRKYINSLIVNELLENRNKKPISKRK